MISKAQIGFIKSLDQKKYRTQNKVFFVEGIKIINELIISEFKLHSVFAVKEWLDNNQTLVSDHPGKINLITAKELKQISSQSTPNQVLAIFEIPETVKPVLKNIPIILCLESIRDPGNFGTIIRLADWYGINFVFCSEDCVDVYNPKVIQSSMGSIARVKVNYIDLKSLLKKSDNFTSYATTLNGKNIHNIQLDYPALILIGNEAHGLSKDLIESSRHQISIPKYGAAESLNAAMATSIILDKFKLSLEQ